MAEPIVTILIGIQEGVDPTRIWPEWIKLFLSFFDTRKSERKEARTLKNLTAEPLLGATRPHIPSTPTMSKPSTPQRIFENAGTKSKIPELSSAPLDPARLRLPVDLQCQTPVCPPLLQNITSFPKLGKN